MRYSANPALCFFILSGCSNMSMEVNTHTSAASGPDTPGMYCRQISRQPSQTQQHVPSSSTEVLRLICIGGRGCRPWPGRSAGALPRGASIGARTGTRKPRESTRPALPWMWMPRRVVLFCRPSASIWQWAAERSHLEMSKCVSTVFSARRRANALLVSSSRAFPSGFQARLTERKRPPNCPFSSRPRTNSRAPSPVIWLKCTSRDSSALCERTKLPRARGPSP
mmetsp:Transcript_33476/g.104284  ORF Transcript_33476/g.104284 Transcript_33476/m.104284 type:complete len:224 (+) Transcript_33476:474-1145(+)